MVVLMREETDCEFAACATACGVTYEQAQAAFPNFPVFNDPLRSNPETFYLALIRLGFWKRNTTWADIELKRAEPGKTIILIHNPTNPTLQQHWIVLAGYCPDGFLVYWGDSETPRKVGIQQMKDFFLKGFPNCAFQVTPDTAWMRFLRWVGLEK